MNDKLFQALQAYSIPAPPDNKRPNAAGFTRWGDRYWLKEIPNTNDPGWLFGDWVDNISEYRFEKFYTKLSQGEKKARTTAVNKAKKEADELLAKEQKQAAEKARQTYDKVQHATATHPYLLKKGVETVAGLKQNARGDLLIPVYNDTAFQSLQTINKTDFEKRFSKGTTYKGGYFIIGDKTCPDKIICEGYATGASIYEAYKKAGKQRAVVVAFNAGNLLPVAINCKQQYPDDEFVIAGDNDCWNGENKNIGKIKAIETTGAINCKRAIACFDSVDKATKPTDYNDLANLGGDIVSQIEQATEPTPAEKLASIKPTDNAFYDLMKILGSVCLFHNNGSVYAKINKTVTPIYSTAVKNWLKATYYDLQDKKKPLPRESIENAIDIYTSKTLQHGKDEPVYKRITGVDGDLYISIKNKDRQLIKITKKSVKVIDYTDKVNFKEIRSATAMALPIKPLKNGDFDLLREYINCNDDDWVLITGFVLGCFMDKPPYPILVLCGGAGTGKTTLTKLLKKLIDPNSVLTVKTPRDPRDIPSMTNNNHLLCFDNNSFITAELSDLLCRIAYGEEDSERRLHTNDEQVIYEYGLPIIINGINNSMNRGDLLDRAVIVELQKLNEYKDDNDLYADFEKDRPTIVAGLFALLSRGLARRDHTESRTGYRYSHWVRWVEACTDSDRFAKVYRHNIQESQQILLQNDPFGSVLLEWIETQKSHGKNGWNDTASELLQELAEYTRNKPMIKVKAIPQAANALSRKLTRLIKPMEQCGISYKNEHTGGNRLIKLDWATINNDTLTINNDTIVIKKPSKNNGFIV